MARADPRAGKGCRGRREQVHSGVPPHPSCGPDRGGPHPPCRREGEHSLSSPAGGAKRTPLEKPDSRQQGPSPSLPEEVFGGNFLTSEVAVPAQAGVHRGWANSSGAKTGAGFIMSGLNPTRSFASSSTAAQLSNPGEAPRPTGDLLKEPRVPRLLRGQDAF